MTLNWSPYCKCMVSTEKCPIKQQVNSRQFTSVKEKNLNKFGLTALGRNIVDWVLLCVNLSVYGWAHHYNLLNKLLL